MSEPVIQVEGLAKRYYIGSSQGRYRTLRDSLPDLATAPFRRAWRLMRGQSTGAADLQEALWALRDVSFEVQPGEVLGVIGQNGSGKSTLLKILSRITEPTEGRARIRGRVGSLLEVGTGFHPELTGRDNVYLNGAILGMRREEIDRRFDEIVAFAEIDKFLDTPVKHYSSGMYVRLAFAVAAHLETEILLVDEVLSVGDVAFQRRMPGQNGTGRFRGRADGVVRQPQYDGRSIPVYAGAVDRKRAASGSRLAWGYRARVSRQGLRRSSRACLACRRCPRLRDHALLGGPFAYSRWPRGFGHGYSAALHGRG